MAYVPEQPLYEEGVYQFETTDPVQGGANGLDNLPSKQLANRTAYLKQHVDALESGEGLPDGGVARIKLGRTAITSHKRNCILSGPVDTDSGLANFMTKASATTVAINGSPVPIRLSFAAGFDDQGPVDYFGKIAADSTLNIALNAGTDDVYIYATRGTGTSATVSVAMTTGPVAISNTEPAGQSGTKLWYDPTQQKWKIWNGTALVDGLCVLLGRVTRLGNGNIDRIFMYDYEENISKDNGVPTGTVLPISTDYTEPPEGYLHCNGAYVSVDVYNRLYSVIGTTYGSLTLINGIGWAFKLPDLRGEFIRGLDAGRGVDASRALGSSQTHQLQDHSHVFRFAPNAPGSGGITISASAGAVDSVGQFINAAINANVGAETRPRNIALPYFIKY